MGQQHQTRCFVKFKNSRFSVTAEISQADRARVAVACKVQTSFSILIINTFMTTNRLKKPMDIIWPGLLWGEAQRRGRKPRARFSMHFEPHFPRSGQAGQHRSSHLRGAKASPGTSLLVTQHWLCPGFAWSSFSPYGERSSPGRSWKHADFTPRFYFSHRVDLTPENGIGFKIIYPEK